MARVDPPRQAGPLRVRRTRLGRSLRDLAARSREEDRGRAGRDGRPADRRADHGAQRSGCPGLAHAGRRVRRHGGSGACRLLRLV